MLTLFREVVFAIYHHPTSAYVWRFYVKRFYQLRSYAYFREAVFRIT